MHIYLCDGNCTSHVLVSVPDSISWSRTSILLNWQLQAVQVPPSAPETAEVIAMIE